MAVNEIIHGREDLRCRTLGLGGVLRHEVADDVPLKGRHIPNQATVKVTWLLLLCNIPDQSAISVYIYVNILPYVQPRCKG